MSSREDELRTLKETFIRVTRDFQGRVLESDPSAEFKTLRTPSSSGKNWFITWRPGRWGHPTNGLDGVHWGLTCSQEAKAPSGRFRLVLGCESPLLHERKAEFMERIVTQARSAHGSLLGFDLVDTHPKQKKLARSKELPLADDGGLEAYELYKASDWFSDIVGEVMREQNRNGWFHPPLRYE